VIRRYMVGGAVLTALATWMVCGVLSSAAAHEHRGPVQAPNGHVPNGNPCAGQELTLKIDGQEGSPILSYGPTTIQGVLHCGTVPIRNAQVAVADVGYVPAGVPAIAPTVTTGLDGSFSYTVPPGPNRTLSFSYTSYSDDPGPSVTALPVTLRVRPMIKLAIEPRKIRNHHAIIWTVTVLGGPFPSQGITLDTQVYTEGKWMTFDETILLREGTTRLYKYTFRRTYRPTTYPFRLRLPATGSGDYPYTSGTSNVVKIRVNP
jgi:hypothetical protein